jgi:hypothetical protein
MNKIKTYSQFLEKEIVQSFGDEKETFYAFIESFYNSDIITTLERRILVNELKDTKTYLIKENFFDKLKTRYEKSKTISSLSKNAKIALGKIVDASKVATDFVMKVRQFLLSNIENMMTSVKDNIKSKLKGDKKLIDKIKEIYELDKNEFLKEIKICKEVVTFYTSLFKNKLVDSITNGLTNFLTKNDEENAENSISVSEKLEYLNESNMIDKLVDGLNHMPPFSWLHKVQHIGESGAKNAIKVLSNATQKLGGPEIVVPTIATIIGIAFEYNVKGLVKHGLLDMVGTFSIPFVGYVIKLVGYTATFIAVVELIRHITKQESLSEIIL